MVNVNSRVPEFAYNSEEMMIVQARPALRPRSDEPWSQVLYGSETQAAWRSRRPGPSRDLRYALDLRGCWVKNGRDPIQRECCVTP